MEEVFSVIVLSDSGDYLVESEDELDRGDNGVDLMNASVFNEEEEAQRIVADKIFIPYESIEAIQYGEFEQEVAR